MPDRDMLFNTGLNHDLAAALNKHNIDTKIGVRDFLLAAFVVEMLDGLHRLILNEHNMRNTITLPQDNT